MQLGKYSTDRDSALHFLCLADWSNESFGNVEAPTGYVWRISNYVEDLTGCIDALTEWFEQEGLEDSEDIRLSAVGHFLVIEDSNGLVHVLEFPNEGELKEHFDALQKEYELWDSQEED